MFFFYLATDVWNVFSHSQKVFSMRFVMSFRERLDDFTLGISPSLFNSMKGGSTVRTTFRLCLLPAAVDVVKQTYKQTYTHHTCTHIYY